MKGIQHYKSPPYCHDTNGIPERYMRTLQTMMRALLDGQDQKLWAEAASAANYLKNRLPHNTLNGQTPFEALFNTKPRIQHLQVYGTLCYTHIHAERRLPASKLSARAVQVRFVGYTDSDSIYRVQSSSGYIYTVKAIDCKFLPSVPAAEEPTTQPTTLETTPSIPASVQGPQCHRNEVQVTVPTLDTSQYQEVTPADKHAPIPPTT